MNGQRSARVLVVVAALLWSSSGFFAKAPWFENWPVESRGLGLACWRAIFAALVISPMIRRPSFQWPMIPMSGCFMVMVLTFLTSMVLGSETNTIWLQYLAPVWVMIGGLMGLGDRPKRKDSVLIAAALIGVGLILTMELRAVRVLPTVLAILSGVTFAGVLLSMRALRQQDGAWLGLLNHGTTAIVLAPLVLTRLPWPTPFQLMILFLFAAVQLAIPYLLFARAIRDLPSHEAALLTLVEPISVPLWTYVAWRHHPSYLPPAWWTMVGAAIIMAGFVLRYLPVPNVRSRTVGS